MVVNPKPPGRGRRPGPPPPGTSRRGPRAPRRPYRRLLLHPPPDRRDRHLDPDGARAAWSRCGASRSRSIPDIAPPEIRVTATYTGADAVTIEQSVATPIEQQVNGVDDMLYMQSINTNDGTHAAPRHLRGRAPNIDIDQRAASRTASRRPSASLPAGGHATTASRCKKSTSSLLLLVLALLAEGHLRRPLPRPTTPTSTSRPAAARPRRRRRSSIFGAADYAMRIWVRAGPARQARPHRAGRRRRDQEAEHGEPGRPGRRRAVAAPARSSPTRVRAQGRLVTRRRSSATSSSAPTRTGRAIRLRDVARVELGAQNYNQRRAPERQARRDHRPSTSCPGSNALEVAAGRQARRWRRLKQPLPAGPRLRDLARHDAGGDRGHRSRSCTRSSRRWCWSSSWCSSSCRTGARR